MVWVVTSGIPLLQSCKPLISIIGEWAIHEGLGREDCNPNDPLPALKGWGFLGVLEVTRLYCGLLNTPAKQGLINLIIVFQLQSHTTMVWSLAYTTN
jgi:hypothetical protein